MVTAALSRPPSEAELEASVRFLDPQLRAPFSENKTCRPDEQRRRALADFAQVLFSLNEFIYVD